MISKNAKRELWNLWTLQKETHRPASEICKISEWVQGEHGFDGWWEAFQFDSAVTWFGRWMESKLNEIDDRGHHVNDIKDLLASEQPSDADGVKAFGALFGVIKGK